MTEHVIAIGVYSFFGAVLEHLNYYAGSLMSDHSSKKTLGNPIITGFPLYAFGAYTIVGINSLISNQNMIIKFLVFAITLTLIEYLVGLFVGAGKTENGIVDAWDYSNRPFNYQGIISLYHFVVWGLLGLLIVEVHPILINKLQCGIKKC